MAHVLRLLACVAAAQALAGGSAHLPLSKVVLSRAKQELRVAATADASAALSIESVAATQREIEADVARQAAEDRQAQQRAANFDARRALTQSAKWAKEAEAYAEHAQSVAEEARGIAGRAADRAAAAIQQEIREDARGSAAGSAAEAEPAGDEELRAAMAVVAEAEPYHLAMLRAQKATAECFEKAKGAQKNALLLSQKARDLAAQAQGLQAQGMTVFAAQLESMAHGTMQAAETMRAWAEKLHQQAQDANNSVAYYQQAQQQAAASAAVAVPAELPPAPALLEVNYGEQGLRASGYIIKPAV